MITKTLSRYAMRFLGSVIGSFIGVVALAALIDYVELMRRGEEWPNATAWLLAKISIYRVPQLAERIMPFSVLVGVMSSYLTLSRRASSAHAKSPRSGCRRSWQRCRRQAAAPYLLFCLTQKPLVLCCRAERLSPCISASRP